MDPAVYLSISEKKPFSERDREILSDELRRTGEDFLIKALTILGLAFLLAILPPRRHRHQSLVMEYGFLKGLLIAILIIGIPIIWTEISNRRKYKKDLLEGAKVVRQTTVLRKERSFLHKKYFIWVDEKDPKHQKFEVESTVYDQLQKGQRIFMEFAPYSGYLLHIDWQVEH